MIDSYSDENREKLEERISFLSYTLGLMVKRMGNPNYGLLREYGPQQMTAAINQIKTERLALIMQVEAIIEFRKS